MGAKSLQQRTFLRAEIQAELSAKSAKTLRLLSADELDEYEKRAVLASGSESGSVADDDSLAAAAASVHDYSAVDDTE